MFEVFLSVLAVCDYHLQRECSFVKEWEALMLEFCDIIGVRSTVEQPVNSRFFRHPRVAALGLQNHYRHVCMLKKRTCHG